RQEAPPAVGRRAVAEAERVDPLMAFLRVKTHVRGGVADLRAGAIEGAAVDEHRAGRGGRAEVRRQVDRLADDAELLLARRSDVPDRRAPVADADAEADRAARAPGAPPLGAPARVRGGERLVQLACDDLHEPIEHRRRITGGDLRKEEREEPVARVLEHDAAMA